ncbi:MAG: glutaredoxin family protein [Armatimonadetes bacterium]|nr:glutaredoxin family protein [Armatimonadota bacterium]
MTPTITVYGADWCGDTKRTRQLLDDAKVGYTYVNADNDKAVEQQLADWNNGRTIYPTLDMNGEIAVNPAPAKLNELLKSGGYVSA